MKKVCFVLLICAVLVLAPAVAQDDPVSIIFMHHSTGWGVMTGGNVREGLTALGYAFWDHDYNDPGLTDPQGNPTGTHWDTPGDNMPADWHYVFNQPVTDPPTNTFSHMLQHDIIIFKSCFPASAIESDDMLEDYKRIFLDIRDIIDQHPDKLFIAWTTPPLVPNSTTPEAAARARRWAEYLTSDAFLEGHPNLAVFDFFNLMADDDGYLRAEYRVDEWDSHPNDIANAAAGPVLVEFVHQAYQDFTPGEAPVAPVETEEPTEPEEEPAAAGLIDDFESGDFSDRWWSYTDEGGEVECMAAEPGRESDHALGMSFTTSYAYTVCGIGGLDASGWAGASGLSFVWRSDVDNVPASVTLSLEDAAYEAPLQTPGEDWTPVSLSWEDFGVAAPFDATQIIGVSFNLGGWDEEHSGTLWVDDLRIEGCAAAPEAAEAPEQTAPPAEGIIGEFEAPLDENVWWLWADAESFECARGAPGYESEGAYQIVFELPADGSGGCGRDVDGLAGSDGLQFVWRSDTPGIPLAVVVTVGDESTPFDVILETPGPEWTHVTLMWDEFSLPDWYGESDQALIPADILTVGFATAHWEETPLVTVQIDNLQTAGK